MTRIAENQIIFSILSEVANNRAAVNKFSNEVASGYKVVDPGDSKFAGTISQYRQTLNKIEGYSSRVKTVQGELQFQDNLVSQVQDLLVRAKEIATQAANESNGPVIRAQMSAEVFQLRDQLVTFANSKYQGRYLYGGTVDNSPPYSALTYSNPSTGSASERYVFSGAAGTEINRSVNVTDDLTVTTTTSGQRLFENSIQALERLGRAMSGYTSTPATGDPDGGGVAYVFPTDTAAQSVVIREALDTLETERATSIMPERVSLGARERRLETAASLLELNKNSASRVLSELQDADPIESATLLSHAQSALEASLTVTARVLNLSILNYL